MIECLRRNREFVLWDAQVFENFVREAFWELAVEPADQGDAFFPVDFVVPNFLRRIVRGSPDPELDEGGVPIGEAAEDRLLRQHI